MNTAMYNMCVMHKICVRQVAQFLMSSVSVVVNCGKRAVRHVMVKLYSITIYRMEIKRTERELGYLDVINVQLWLG